MTTTPHTLQKTSVQPSEPCITQDSRSARKEARQLARFYEKITKKPNILVQQIERAQNTPQQSLCSYLQVPHQDMRTIKTKIKHQERVTYLLGLTCAILYHAEDSIPNIYKFFTATETIFQGLDVLFSMPSLGDLKKSPVPAGCPQGYDYFLIHREPINQ